MIDAPRPRLSGATCLALGLAAAFGCGGAGAGAGAEAPEPRGEPIRLEVSLEAGAVYEGDLLMKQELPTGQEIDTEIDVRTRVVDVEDGVFTLEDEYADVRITMDGEPVELRDELKGLEQLRVRYRLDRRGRRVGEPSAEGVTDDNRASAEQLVQSMGEGAVPFPERPVQVGESWEGRRELEMPTRAGKLQGEVRETHRLEGVETEDGRRWAVMDIGGDVQIEPLEREQIVIRGGGRVTGERRVLLSDGFTSQSESEVVLELDAETGDPPQQVEITQRTATELDIRRVEEDPSPEPEEGVSP